MWTKRSLIALLLAANLMLLAALVAGSLSPPSAFAQGGAQRGDLVSVTAKIAGQDHDMLYILDVPARKLYGIHPVVGRNTKLTAVPPRDLAKDFNR